MDPVEEIYNAMQIDSALYSRMHASAPWGIAFNPISAVRFELVVQGKCQLESKAIPHPLALVAGDCFVINQQVSFRLWNGSTDTSFTGCETLFANHPRHEILTWGGGGEIADLIMGHFYFDEEFGSPLFNVLPGIIHIPQKCIHTHLLQATLQLINYETVEQKIGSQLMIKRLADILLIQALRSHFFTDKAQTSWVAGWHDQRLKSVLQAIHSDLGQHWQVSELANIAGMSRAAFSAYFKHKTGEPLLTYLTRWRIYRAKYQLRHSQCSLSQIATQVGYETDSVFSRFFKHHTGLSPGQFRAGKSKSKSSIHTEKQHMSD